MKTTRYFREDVPKKRPYLRAEWCERVRLAPMQTERQSDGRWRFWGFVAELQEELARRSGRRVEEEVGYLRVVTLEDGETLHSAMPDRNYDRRQRRRS